MPNRLDRSQFLQTLQGTKIDVATANADEKLRKVLPMKADLDNNGSIEGDAEINQLFTQIDSFGRNPDINSTSLVGPDGKGTTQAVAMRALGELTHNAEIMGWTAGLDLTQQVDLSQIRTPDGVTATPEAMVGAAAMMIRERKDNYGVRQPWYNLDPNHALPANKPIRGLGETEARPNGVWKCNLFGGNAVYAAGFEPPYYGNQGRGEYPNANQFYKFSDKYAGQFGNKVHFKMVDEVALAGLPREQVQARLIEVLRSAQPGDLLMVKHSGGAVADGGHTRVVMQNDMRPDGTGNISSAQATYSEAAIRAEGLSSFTNEDHVWILRPNRPRVQTPAQPTAPVVTTPVTPPAPVVTPVVVQPTTPVVTSPVMPPPAPVTPVVRPTTPAVTSPVMPPPAPITTPVTPRPTWQSRWPFNIFN